MNTEELLKELSTLRNENRQNKILIQKLQIEIHDKIRDLMKKDLEIMEKNNYIDQLENSKGSDLYIPDIISETLEDFEVLSSEEDSNDSSNTIQIHVDDDLPWKKYTDDELIKEYNRLKLKLKETIRSVDPIPFSAIGCKCTNYFFQYERLNTPSIWKPSSVEFWKHCKDKVYLFSKNKKDLYSTLNFYNHTPGQFLVMTAAKLYKHFNIKKIFDPYAGWGDRCLAAMSLDIDYIGVDSNINLKDPYEKIIEFYETKSKVKMYFEKSENLVVETFDFDFVFTSPPFWKNNQLVENYNNCEGNYNTFMNNSLIPIMKKCLPKNIWVCLYIPENMYNDLAVHIGPCKKIIKFKSCSTRCGEIFCWNNE
jgi:hypothetical protein